jgi:hypothetical protein
MAGDDQPFAQALGARRAHVVVVHDLEHAGPRVAHEHRGARQTEGERGQREVAQVVGQRPGLTWRRNARGGEDLPLDRQKVHQDHAEKEVRDRDAGEAKEGERVVQPRVLLQRRNHAQRDADHDREQQRDAHELQGGRQARADHLGHRFAALEGKAEVALQQLAEPACVLLVDRQVQAKLAAPQLDQVFGLRRLGRDHRLHRVAGHLRGDEEHDHRDPEQDRDADQQAAQKVGEHGSSLVSDVGATACAVASGFQPYFTSHFSTSLYTGRSKIRLGICA